MNGDGPKQFQKVEKAVETEKYKKNLKDAYQVFKMIDDEDDFLETVNKLIESR